LTIALSPLAGAGWQFFDDNGVPLAGGKLYTYLSGTSTPATTYTSSTGGTANTNPIILDAAGRVSAEVWLTDDIQYRLVLQNSVSVQIWLKDNISTFLSNSGRPVVVPSSSSPSQTTAGSLVWNSTSALLTSGNGTGRVTFMDTTTAQTVTNKRVVPRVQSTGPTSPFTPDASLYDNIYLNSISAPLTINAATGGVSAQRLLFRITDNGTARALTWDALYRAIGVTIPTTTVAGKTIYVGCIYNPSTGTWDVVAVATQA
jgi:hypothetical protein